MKRLLALGLVGFFCFGFSPGLTSLHAQEAPAATATETPAAETPAAEAETPATEAAAEAPAEEATLEESVAYSFNNFMLFFCAVLVIFMQAGFALVETGLNAGKNAVNILFKNTADFVIGVIAFYCVGYALMYPGGDFKGGYFGYKQPDFSAAHSVADIKAMAIHPQVDFLFQAAFCATAATIVSGAVAGRLKFSSYLIYTLILTAVVYPIGGFWKWGYGWLDAMGFHDFAGSIVVHACGGFAGLAGAIALGPRLRRYSKEGKSQPMPGHNLAYVTLGVFILMIGWYGFNPGSKLAFVGLDNVTAVMKVAVNTTLAACTGGLVGMFGSWILWKKPDLTMCLNGILAGLVGITANCDVVTNGQSLIIGAVAGVIVIAAIVALDKLKIDDPVGAFPVHGACGVWGGIATGIFGEGKVLMTQVIGSTVIPVFAFVTMGIVFFGLKAIGQLRVSEKEEIEGLDIHEHGMPCYGSDTAY